MPLWLLSKSLLGSTSLGGEIPSLPRAFPGSGCSHRQVGFGGWAGRQPTLVLRQPRLLGCSLPPSPPWRGARGKKGAPAQTPAEIVLLWADLNRGANLCSPLHAWPRVCELLMVSLRRKEARLWRDSVGGKSPAVESVLCHPCPPQPVPPCSWTLRTACVYPSVLSDVPQALSGGEHSCPLYTPFVHARLALDAGPAGLFLDHRSVVSMGSPRDCMLTSLQLSG